MAEQLGDAVLYLRTDDTAFDRGVTQAEGKAVRLGGALDRTTASSDRLGPSLGKTGQAAERAGAGFEKQAVAVVSSSRAQQAGLQNLGRQIGDISTMYALGMRPSMIFASQIGQVADAVQQATGGASRFARFLGGPWGIALMVAVQALAPFVGKLFESAEASELAETGANALATAQTALGDVFDLVSGKLKTQNELLILNARLTAMNLRAEALAKRTGARETFVDAQRPGSVNVANPYGAGIAHRAAMDEAAKVTDLLRRVGRGETTRDQALVESQKIDFSQTRVSRADFQQALIDTATANLNNRVADLIDQSLDSGELAAGLRREGKTPKPKRGPKPPKDRSAEIAARAAEELARLEQEELRAKLELTTNIDERADLQQQLLGLERDERMRQIDADKDLDDKQKAAQRAFIDRLYGTKPKLGADGSMTVEENDSPYARRIRREWADREAALANDAIQRQIVALDAQAAITTNLKERDALERKALELQQAIEDNLLEQDIANGRVADADAARALLAEKQAAEREGQLRDQRGPMQRYRDGLREAGENIDLAVEDIQAEGLRAFNEELTDAIMGTKSLGDAFHNVAQQIIADLVRIGIQQSIVRPLAEFLFGSSGGGEGSNTGGLVASIIGSFFGGGRATGGPVSPGQFYAVNERSSAPGLFFPIAPGVIQPPSAGSSAAAARPAAGGASPMYIDLRNSFVDSKLWSRVEEIATRTSQQNLRGYNRIVGDVVTDHFARYGG